MKHKTLFFILLFTSNFFQQINAEIDPQIPAFLYFPDWIKKDIEWFYNLQHKELSSYLFNIFEIKEVFIPSNTDYISWMLKYYNALPLQINSVLKENRNISVTYKGWLYEEKIFEAEFSTTTFFEGYKLLNEKFINLTHPKIKIKWISAHTSNDGKKWDVQYMLIKKYKFVVNKTVAVIPHTQQEGCIIRPVFPTTSIDFEKEIKIMDIVEKYVPIDLFKKEGQLEEPIPINLDLSIDFKKGGYIYYDSEKDRFGFYFSWREISLPLFIKAFCPNLLEHKSVFDVVKRNNWEIKISAYNDWQIFGKKLDWSINLEGEEDDIWIKIEESGEKIKIINFEKIPEEKAAKMVTTAIPYHKLRKFFSLPEKPEIKYKSDSEFSWEFRFDLKTTEKAWIIFEYNDVDDIVDLEINNFPLDIFIQCFNLNILDNKEIKKFVKNNPNKSLVYGEAKWQKPYTPIKNWFLRLFNPDTKEFLTISIVDEKVNIINYE